MNAKLIY